MIEWPHGIEGVGGVAGAGFHAIASGLKSGIRVADADKNFAPRRLRNHFECSGKFRGNGHHADVPASSSPESIKDLQGRLYEIRGRMNAATLVAEKRTFQMNAERQGFHGA